MDIASRFITSAPNGQSIIDLFDGEWSSAMPNGSGVTSRPGLTGLFDDPRLHWAARTLGPGAGAEILELGPLEGAHSYMLHRMGAESVVAVEANTRAFVKCLCIKGTFDLQRVRFELGSFVPYLKNCERFDIIVASGVLYHMSDPLKVLDLLTRRSDRIYVWTHYFDADLISCRSDNSVFCHWNTWEIEVS